jgi:hypothetical protein
MRPKPRQLAGIVAVLIGLAVGVHQVRKGIENGEAVTAPRQDSDTPA